MSIAIPPSLRELLSDSWVEAPTLALGTETAIVLEDNEMPFFRAFTNHGTRHVEGVLAAATRLVPEEAWRQDLLTPEDAAALICAVILHDIGMHVREKGFIELLAPESRFRPLSWGPEARHAHTANLPWRDLWDLFRSEARHFSTSELDRILGPQNEGVPAVAVGEGDRDPRKWRGADRLLIGEFLRRHHGRLAHEIAIYGFPGTDAPPLTQKLPALADAIGAIARSHNEPLRRAVDYFQAKNPGNLRPGGVVATYLMALLRIADYLQLDSARAPLLLLQLKAPQSPQSLDEWTKHGAVASISWDHQDPGGIFVEVGPDHGLRTHLQLVDLVQDLQREMDTASAVLSETYSRAPFSCLRLSRRRVHSNLNERSLHQRLPYVPRRAELRSAQDLFRVVVDDLYGNQPVVAGRELVQNAVDAVRERYRWSAAHPAAPAGDDFFAKHHDVEVELRECSESQLELRVADRGIGMTPETVIDYYLRAGASLQHASPEPTDRSPDVPGAWVKAGRFGIGAFAGFLLGPEIRVRTRHVAHDRGVEFRARLDGDLVELRWAAMPYGTQVVVPFESRMIAELDPVLKEHGFERLEVFVRAIADHYALRTPRASYRLLRRDGTEVSVDAQAAVPPLGRRLPDVWRLLDVKGYDAVLWSVATEFGPDFLTGFPRSRGPVIHNGMAIRNPRDLLKDAGYRFEEPGANAFIRRPPLAIFDSAHRFRVTLTRYDLVEETIGFDHELLRSIGEDVVAHALAAGERTHPLGTSWGLRPVVSRTGWMPFLPSLLKGVAPDLWVLWLPDPVRFAAVDGSPAARLFLNRLSSATWRQMPVRTVLEEGDEIFRDEDRTSFDLFWGFSDVTGALTYMSRVTGRRPVAASVLQSSKDGRFRVGSGGSNWSLIDDADGRAVFRPAGLRPSDLSSEQELAETVVTEVAKRSGKDILAIACLRRFPELDVMAAAEPVADRWSSTIGGFLDRSKPARERRAAEIAAENRRMGVLINKWRRLDQRRTEEWNGEIMGS